MFRLKERRKPSSEGPDEFQRLEHRHSSILGSSVEKPLKRRALQDTTNLPQRAHKKSFQNQNQNQKKAQPFEENHQNDNPTKKLKLTVSHISDNLKAFHREKPAMVSTPMQSLTNTESSHNPIKLLDLRPLILRSDFSGTAFLNKSAPARLLSDIIENPTASENSFRLQANSHIRAFLSEQTFKRGIRLAEGPLEGSEKRKRKELESNFEIKKIHQIGKYMFSVEAENAKTGQLTVVGLIRAGNQTTPVPGDLVYLQGPSTKCAFAEEIKLYRKWCVIGDCV